MQSCEESVPDQTACRTLPALAIVMLLSLPNAVLGQVVDTNRPGFSFTPGVVAAGRWQLETGIAYDRPDSGSHSVSLPLAEARFGLSEGVEIFVSSIGWKDADSVTASSSTTA